MAKTSNCLQLIDRMPQQDQDAILARLDALQAKGLTAKEAQLQAAIDVLAQVEREGQARKSPPRLSEDIPNDEWLQGKIDYATSKGRNQWGVPHMSTVTGYFDKPVEVSLRVLSRLKGERDEQNNVREDSLEYIRKNWDEVSQQPPYIEVAYNGEAWVSEGNHRIMVAAENGLESMPVEIRYFDGGQRRNGPLNPSRIPSLEDGSIRKSADREANFKRWTRDLPVIEADFSGTYDGGPAVFQAYHGTTHTDITEFKNIGSKEGALGQGPYFSTSVNDVNENYAGVGPDLTSRIGREIDNVAQGFDDDAWYATDVLQAYFDDNGIDTEITDDNIEELKDEHRDKAIEHAATKALKGDSDGFVMPVYVRLEKPFNMAASPTYFEMTYPVNEDGEPDYEAEPEGSALDLINAINEVASGYNADADSLTSWVYENGTDGVSAREVWDRASKDMSELYDDNGEMISSGQFMQEVAREMGFDGLIQDADAYFGTQRRGFGGIRAGAMKGVEPGTLHIMPFDGAQVKSATGNSGEFGENREILKSAERIARTPEFTKWFGDSLVVNADGTPKVVFRGEHGANGGIDFQSRLASLSFGTSEVASAYAGEPNDSADIAEAPRLYPVYLRIENPLMNDPSDPFIELGDIADKLGMDVAESAARKFAPEIEGTGNWEENFADDYDSVDQLLDERPEAVRELYTLAWRFFDMPEFVNAAKKAGYDGAIHAEYGTHSENEEGAEYKVFDQAQVKSIFNKAPTNSRDITKSVDRPQFYSQLQRTIEGVPDRLASMAAPQWKLWLDSNGPKAGVKKDEIEWSGIKDYLDLQGKKKLSKDELSVYLDDSGVKVSEVVLGGAFGATERMELERLSDIPRRDRTEAEASRLSELQNAANQEDSAGRGTKYAQYTLPGGENYRELLITLPGGVSGKELAALDERIQELEDDRDGAEYDERDEIDQRIAAVQAERKALLGNGYRSGHWDEPNVLAHIRINDRTAQEPGYVVRNTRSSNPSEVFATREQAESYQAKLPASVKTEIVEQPRDVRVLFVEEVQSDWGQDGLKKGFKPSDAQIKANGEKSLELRKRIMELRKQGFVTPDDGTPASEIDPKFLELRSLLDQEEELRKKGDFYRGLPPSAPFVTKTEGWLNLALKRIAMLAVEGGYDKVAFVNGEQSADRYDLSKQISRVVYNPTTETLNAFDSSGASVLMRSGVAPEQVEDYVGKEPAKRLFDPQNTKTERRGGKDVAYHEIAGEDLKVGGEGMKAFYDQIVPQALNKLLPKLGGDKLGAVNIGSMDTKQGREGDALLAQLGIEVKGKRPPTQLGFDVTDKMRETVKQGLPLFSRDRQTNTPEFKKWFGDSKVVDADGNPMVVYTGTSKDVDFKSFKIPRNGAWFTYDPYTASAYALENDSMSVKTEDYRTFTNVNTASRVMPVYLRIEKMYTPTYDEMTALIRASNYKREQGNLFDRVRRDGFDGVDMGGGVFVVIKDPAQIKSAIGNDGGFDSSKKEITKSRDRKAPDTKEFKAWFGDSKVVNAKGEPLVVYHGTNQAITAFDPVKVGTRDAGFFGSGFYFTPDENQALDYADTAVEDAGEGEAVAMPLYASLQNPFIWDMSDAGADATRAALASFGIKRDSVRGNSAALSNAKEREVFNRAVRAAGFDGVIVRDEDGVQEVVAFDPTQIKSATGNNGDFDGGNPDIRKSTARKPWFEDLSKLKVSTNYQLGDLLKTSRKLSWWDRTIGTQYNLAQKQPEFKRVFDAVQTFINDVSAYATRAADLAPTILPKLDGLKDIIKKPMSAEDVAALRDPVFGGTLKYARDENGEIYEEDDVQKAGVVFTDEELKSLFKLSDAQIGLYRQFRSSVDQSVTDLALSDMIRYLGEDGRDIAETVMASGNVDVAVGVIESHLADLAKSTRQRAETLAATTEAIQQKGEQANRLMDRGYAPLSRFGQFTTYVVGKDGEQLYFGMFENERDAQKMAREMREQYPDATVSTSTMSQESYKLFSGVTPETLALFGESLGLEESGIDTKSEVFQQYLKVAKTNRSAMKRLIQRKGVDGFSEDAGRVLAGFVYSNARQISTNLHAGEIGKAAADVKDGDVKDAAIRLMEYIQNPQEEAQAIRGLMFTQFIGGSIASALVNMTQPFTMTAPYLAQFDGATGAAKRMADAMKLATKGVRNDADLKDALKRAEDLGIVSPQEVHQLMAQARGKGSLITGDGTKVGDAAAKANNFTAKLGLAWGKAFSAAEQFNRRITFIAAYKLARDQGMADPMAFAEKTIAETQGVYNKGNKPAWARGAIGGTLFTFKQYSISYVEFLQRMWGNGPEGKKAVGLALGVLFFASGLGGLPGMDDLDDVIDGFAQRVLGKSFDSKQAKKEFLASMMGQPWAEFVMGGLTSLPGAPIDLSGRLGLGNLIPGTGLLTKKSDYSRDTAEIFGPAGSLFKQVATGAGKLVQGDATDALKEVAPVAVQNVIKGVDMATMGMYRDTKGRKVIDTDPWEAVAKAVGFQPSSVKRVQDATGTQQNLIGQNKLRETEIADKWAAGRIERNPSKVEEAKAELAEWNRKNPQSPISIDASQINRRVQQAMMSKAKRLEKTAPKEIRQSVKQELERASN